MRMIDKSDKKIKYLCSAVSINFCCVFNFSYGKKEDPKCIFKRRYSFLYISRLVSLLLCGRITLKVIFYYFYHYIFKIYKCINQHFEEPNRVLFQQYRCTPLFLHLKQWHTANEAESLLVVQYATKPKNPV